MESKESSSSSSKSPLPSKLEEVLRRGSRVPVPKRKPESLPIIHEVFLSFRGEDTRASFTSHLHCALQNAGIKVFIDDIDLQRGDYISTSLSYAIEQSQISIIVFSTNYADSRWCMDELRKIMECHRTKGQVVVPVFYHIDPSEVRHQRGEFGTAFHCFLDKTPKELDFNPTWDMERRIRKWKETLREAASIAGNESKDIKDIVDKVSHLLNKTDLFIANNPVGIESRVQDVIRLLHTQTNGVLLLGMWGMGGIGKTTIAKAIYNKIGRSFEGRSFLANIREVGERIAGQVSLQEQLLFDICKATTMKIPNIESGKNTLKHKLCHRRVLIVLDDVNTLDQLNAFCGSHEWFGSGSIIIITTRDMHLLGGKVDIIYDMTIMNEGESIELLSWNAFKRKNPVEDFDRISKNVVEYSGGLPLALEVLGSYLFGRGLTEWENVLEKLRRIPNAQVQNKLRISYDGLNDDLEKEVFLDIACFFIGMDRNDVIDILNGCGLYAEIGICILVERSLLTVDNKNKLGMHDLLRDMGREIIREKSPKEPEGRSRLWFHKDVLSVLSEQTGTQAVEGLALNLVKDNTNHFSTKAFEKMNKLRLLQLTGVQLDGDFDYLSRKLRWLCWNGFPLTCIPTNLYQGNLVSMELENSNINLVWKDNQRMEKLKILNLSHSRYLTQTPDFTHLPNIEKLVLMDCPRLSKISHSIRSLKKILLINLEDCTGLSSLPRSIYELKSLKTLNISGCSIYKLEDYYEDIKSLTDLNRLIENNTALWIECGPEHDVSFAATKILDAIASESTSATSQDDMKYRLIHLGMNCQVNNGLKEYINRIMEENGGYLLPGDNYPYWLAFNCEGSSITFEVPQVKRRMLKSIMIYIVFSSTPNNITPVDLKTLLVTNFTKATIQLYKREALVPIENEEGRRVVSSMKPGNKVEFVVVFMNGFIVKNTTIYLVYEEPTSEDENVSDAENECFVREVSPQVAPVDDLAHNKRKTVKDWFSKYRCC